MAEGDYFVNGIKVRADGAVYTTTTANMADLANTSDAAKGDALIGVKLSATGAVATTQHERNEKTPFLSEFSSQANYEAARDAITGTMAVPNLYVNGTLTTDGHALFTDNTFDIGASGATRPRSIYWGTQALAPNGTASAPAYAGANFLTTGWYFATGKLLGSVLGTRSFEIDATSIYGGTSAGNAITSATNNVMFGIRAARQLSTGTEVVAIGSEVLRGAWNGSSAVAIGANAGFTATAGSNFVVIGQNAANALTDLTNMTLVGRGAGQVATSATNMTAVGMGAAGSSSGPHTGDKTCAFGVTAGQVLKGASGSCLFGFETGKAITDGNNNALFGDQCGKAITVGGSNSAFGRAAINSMVTGGFCVALGHAAGFWYTSGDSNVWVGNQAGNPQITITGAADNGSGLIRITAAGHRLTTGNTVNIAGILGTTEANGDWTVTVITTSTFDLQGSTFANAYTSGGGIQVKNRTGAFNCNVGELSGVQIPAGANTATFGTNAVTHISNTGKFGNALTDTCISGRLFATQTISAEATAAGVTYSVAQFLGGVINRSGPGAGFNDTTPTAVAIVAAIPGCEAGSGFDLEIVNTSGFLLTMLAGTNVTLAGTTTVATVQTRRYRVRVTNATTGSEAVTVQGISTAAN